MKCPKCDYLGFETGDRCKNCGYDFSLIAAPPDAEVDLSLAPPESPGPPVADLWLDREDLPLASAEAGEAIDPESAYPLFAPEGPDDEQPLITLPAAPRAPLAVRRTPDLSSRPRAASRPSRKADRGLTLEFAEEVPPAAPAEAPDRLVSAPAPPSTSVLEPDPVEGVASMGSRLVAAIIDHAILFGIDAVVIYGTLKMTALTMSDWRVLPAVPLLAFLALIKLSYFSAFTAMGGQTIGKMAAGIRVVSDDEARLEPARAISRTLTGAISLLSFGIGLIPAFIGQERRAFHDRIAHTRVIHLPTA